MSLRKGAEDLLKTNPKDIPGKLWRVDDDIAADWKLISEDKSFGQQIGLGEVERLLQQFPTGFVISPEGEVFRIDKVMGYNPEAKQGLLAVKKLGKMYRELLYGRE